jgi:hypothetical protein
MGNHTTSTAADPTSPAPPAKKSSPVRLLILLAILAIVVGALGYDHLVAKPAWEAKYVEIQKMVDERNQQGIGKADLVRSKDIQAVVGFPPTYTEVGKDKTVEWYCWWGQVPVINKRRRFITVVYEGNEPRRYSSHHQEAPPEDVVPDSSPATSNGSGKDTPEGPPASGAEPADSAEPSTPESSSESPGRDKPAESTDKPAESADKPAESADKPAESTDKPAAAENSTPDKDKPVAGSDTGSNQPESKPE